MSVSDFLFNGSPPPSVTTYGTSTANLPAWYSDYTQGLLSKANAVAAEPYQTYGGPRIADFTQDQQSAFDATKSNVGAYQPDLQQGIGTLGQAAGMSPYGASSSYLGQADQSAANTVDSYMNPYTNDVVNRIGDLAGRNLTENLLPGIGDQFTGAGQYGSSRQQEMQNRAVRDTDESALAAQSSALQQGYGQSMTAAQNDLSRYGNIGQVAGNLTSAGMQNLNTLANSYGTLSQTGQTMGLKDAASLDSIGQEQQNLTQQNLNTAYGDFVDQRNYPQQQVGFLSNTIRGMNMPTSTSTTATGPASSYSASPLATLASGLGGLASVFGTKAKTGGYVQTKRGKPSVGPAPKRLKGALQMAAA